MKTCTTCGREWSGDHTFCPHDGTVLRAPDSDVSDLVGTVIAERYLIKKKLGEGGMGAVYLGEHVRMGQQAAIKIIARRLASEVHAIARFTREARNAARIKHPNVCTIYDFGDTPDGLIYLAMEYVQGESLSDMLDREGRLLPQRASTILSQCCAALHAAHVLDIVHRDIKPDNIMISADLDGNDVVKVVDFGIAKAVAGGEGQTVTQTGFVVGTPQYMSPEQVSSDPLDGRSDIYSLALVFFKMLTNGLPFRGDTTQKALLQRVTAEPMTLAEVWPEGRLPPQLQEVLDKALASNRDDRYETAVEFGQAVGDAMVTAQSGVASVDAVTPTNLPSKPPPTKSSTVPVDTALTGDSGPRPTPTTVAEAPAHVVTPETPLPRPSQAIRVGSRRAAAFAVAIVMVGVIVTVWRFAATTPEILSSPDVASSDTATNQPEDSQRSVSVPDSGRRDTTAGVAPFVQRDSGTNQANQTQPVATPPDSAEEDTLDLVTAAAAQDEPELPAHFTVDEAPQLISSPGPEYPVDLYAQEIEGQVLFEFVLGVNGKAEPASITVIESSHPGFDDAARRVIEASVFTPGRIEGQAVRTFVRIPIDFVFRPKPDRLEDSVSAAPGLVQAADLAIHGIPIPLGSELVEPDVSNRAVYRCDAAAEELRQFFDQYLPNDGWNKEELVSTEVLLVFTKGNITAWIAIPEEGGSFTIRS